MKWFLKCIRHYADFKGRARRKEYWMFALISGLIGMPIAMLRELFGNNTALEGIWGTQESMGLASTSSAVLSVVVNVIYLLWTLFILVPSLAVMVRRLHDTGRSGKILIPLFVLEIIFVILAVIIELFGGEVADTLSILLVVIGILFLAVVVWVFVLTVKPGDIGPNRYGSDPKALDEIALD